MTKSTQNPKLTHLEKLVETLAGKVRQTLDDQARIAHNPETAQAAAEKIAEQLQAAYTVAFEKNAPILSADSIETTGWYIDSVSSVRNLARDPASMASIFTYVNNGTAEFSAIWQPKQHRLAYASKGLGAFIQDAGRLRMSTQEELGGNTVVSLPWATADASAPLKTAGDNQFHTRKTGCVAADVLAVTSGSSDVCVAAQLTPAAEGALLLFTQEAGGKTTVKNDVVIASNTLVHAAAIKLFA